MKVISGKKLLSILKSQGWIEVKIEGSHDKLHNVDKDMTVVVPVHGNRDLKTGLLSSLMKSTGLSDKDL